MVDRIVRNQEFGLWRSKPVVSVMFAVCLWPALARLGRDRKRLQQLVGRNSAAHCDGHTRLAEYAALFRPTALLLA